MKFCDRHPLGLHSTAVLFHFLILTTKHTNGKERKILRRSKIFCVFNNDRINKQLSLYLQFMLLYHPHRVPCIPLEQAFWLTMTTKQIFVINNYFLCFSCYLLYHNILIFFEAKHWYHFNLNATLWKHFY